MTDLPDLEEQQELSEVEEDFDEVEPKASFTMRKFATVWLGAAVVGLILAWFAFWDESTAGGGPEHKADPTGFYLGIMLVVVAAAVISNLMGLRNARNRRERLGAPGLTDLDAD